MAGIIWNVENNTAGFSALAKQFPTLAVRVLARIGSHGRRYLKDVILIGDLHVSRFTRTRTGLFPAMYYASKKFSRLTFWSYPTNMHKRKKLLTGKFAMLMDSKMSRLAAIAEREVIDRELAKI